MLRIDTLGKCRRRSALYARTPEKGASRKPINRQLHKTRFAEAGGVALGYLDTRYRPQHLVGVHKNPPPRESATTLAHGLLRPGFYLLHAGQRACAQGWWAGLPRVVGPFGEARIGENPRGEVGRFDGARGMRSSFP